MSTNKGADIITKICEYCRREMTDGGGCSRAPHMFADGEIIGQIKFGDEGTEGLDLYERCPVCGCEKGQYHHLGCSIELCPRCRKPLTECQCKR